MQSSKVVRNVRIFRYDPVKGGEGTFQSYQLTIDNPETTTILDVLLRIQKEQDPSISFRFACRVNMCGSCGMVINGREGLACKTNVCDLPADQDITLRPLNHFPVIKDLLVDMGPFFSKYEDALPFFEPAEKRTEPYVIKPDTPERVDIGMATDCIACGCCVSSCTMVDSHDSYCGPAALNRAFTLLADKRDGLFEARLTRALDSCYNCRTEFNCTEVCPNRANTAIQVPGHMQAQILHIDYMCNECGNCRTFCPWGGAPYVDKFTLFANEDDLDHSDNSGFAVLDKASGFCKVRLDGEIRTTTLGTADEAIPEDLRTFMETVCRDYDYLLIE